MAFWIRKGSLWWEHTNPAPCSSWELIQDFSFSLAGPGNHPWKRGEAVLPELSEKASGGGRVRKDFRTSYAYELRRTSKYPPTLFSRQTPFPSFRWEHQASSEPAWEGPGTTLPIFQRTPGGLCSAPDRLPTPSREEGSQVGNNPNTLSTSLEPALIIDSTVYFKALNGR